MLVVTGLKKQPGLGIIGTLILIGVAIWLRGDTLATLGFSAPENWAATILLGLTLGIVLQLFAVVLIEPSTEKLTNSTHDQSILENVKGDWKAYIQWILLVWIFVALIEEGIYRGFLITETARVIGSGLGALIFNVIFSSMVFGLSHGYQGPAGIWSTGIIGIFLACIFIFCDYNLWLAVFTHGFIDTIGIALIAVDGDQYIRQKLWKDRSSPH